MLGLSSLKSLSRLVLLCFVFLRPRQLPPEGFNSPLGTHRGHSWKQQMQEL